MTRISSLALRLVAYLLLWQTVAFLAAWGLIWVLMISFGAGYGYTVMSRVSLLIGRFQYLIQDWLHLR